MFLEEIKIPLPSCMRLLLVGVLLVSSSDSGVGTSVALRLLLLVSSLDSGVGTSVRHTNGQRLTNLHGEAAGI